jgi:polysaccharide pyruvyl transferase WcaK-like protein
MIPHVISDNLSNDNDRVVINALVKEFSAAHRAPDFRSPSEAKSFIAGMDFMTGARMHACIAAFSSGVPVVPLAYSRKFNGLFSKLEYPWLVDGKTMNTDEAFRIICTGFERRQELADLLVKGNLSASDELARYEIFLTETLGAISAASFPDFLNQHLKLLK